MRRLIHCGVVVMLGILATGCASDRHASARLERLGKYSFQISTDSPQAQRAFDRGLTLAYSFGHYAAEQEFRRALAADPNCAMAYWGIALVNGPHINNPFVSSNSAAVAWQSVTRAQELMTNSSPVEQALIQAQAARYAHPNPEDRSPLNTAYADAMREVWRKHPDNADVATLFAESVMDCHPWDYWNKGLPQTWTPEIVQALERAMQITPEHPGANHYYIHMLEASSEPGRAEVQADRLGALVPDSSHMVHMPAHIYTRVGRWEDAAAANRSAMKADVVYRKAYPRPGFYSIYMAHNAHFLTWVYMMQGQSAAALASARKVIAGISGEFLDKNAALVDGFMVVEIETLMRFGRWEEILRSPEPRADLFLSRALWRYARAAAFTALGRMSDAATEREAFALAAAAVPSDRTMGNNLATNLVAIATLALDGEMAAQAGNIEVAVAKLREAVKLEDKLVYDEPPDWIQPVRHTLGAVLLRAGRAEEAETVYREDLQIYPENGWSLMGLRDALRKQGKTSEADATDGRFRAAWAQADVSPSCTCYCQAGR